MSCHASTAGWNSGHNAGGAGPNSGWSAGQRRCGPPRGLEIAGIVLGFIFFWPAALAYLIWKCTGYPVPNEAKAFFEKNFSRLGGAGGWPWNGAGNGARGPGASSRRPATSPSRNTAGASSSGSRKSAAASTRRRPPSPSSSRS